MKVGDRVSWMGGTDFGSRNVRWVGVIVGLGYGVPFGEVGEDGRWHETGRHPAARVEADYPQHDKPEPWPCDAPLIIALTDLSKEQS